MRYEMRTTFTLEQDKPMLLEGAGRADRVLRWLHEYLPTVADMGIGPSRGRWVGHRYETIPDRAGDERQVNFQLLTEYPDVYAATADKLRIARALVGKPPAAVSTVPLAVSFDLFQLYDDAELGDPADTTKGIVTHPQKIAHPG
jgi:hypothetical protein